MVSVGKFKTGHPSAVRLSGHWSSPRIPVVKIADQENFLRLRCLAEEMGAMKVLFCEVARQCAGEIRVIEYNLFFRFVVRVFDRVSDIA